MPKKPGNGGHGPEEYDVNTGKYVADGQPNKYYDNPDENASNKAMSSRIPLDKLKEKFGDIFGESEYDNEINAMFGWSEEKEAETLQNKYTKPVTEMSQEELLTEIGEHKQYLIDKGINLNRFKDAFNNDLRLKCANFRQMQRLMEEYPIELNGCEFVNSHAYSSESGSQAYMQFKCSYTNGYIPNTKMNFNAKFFTGYDSVLNSEKEEAKTKWHQECGDDLYSSYTFTHEYGHAIFNNIIYKLNLFPRNLLDDAFNKNLSKIEITTNIYGRQVVRYRGKNYRYSQENINAIAARLTQQEMKKAIKTQAERIFDETFSIFSEQNKDVINKQNDFTSEMSRYAKSGGIHEWFAETFASLECGKPTKSALALREWLSRNGHTKGA